MQKDKTDTTLVSVLDSSIPFSFVWEIGVCEWDRLWLQPLRVDRTVGRKQGVMQNGTVWVFPFCSLTLYFGPVDRSTVLVGTWVWCTCILTQFANIPPHLFLQPLPVLVAMYQTRSSLMDTHRHVHVVSALHLQNGTCVPYRIALDHCLCPTGTNTLLR